MQHCTLNASWNAVKNSCGASCIWWGLRPKNELVNYFFVNLYWILLSPSKAPTGGFQRGLSMYLPLHNTLFNFMKTFQVDVNQYPDKAEAIRDILSWSQNKGSNIDGIRVENIRCERWVLHWPTRKDRYLKQEQRRGLVIDCLHLFHFSVLVLCFGDIIWQLPY